MKNNKDFFILLSISIIVFIIIIIRSLLIPFTHDEVATFYYYIQRGIFLPYSAHIDANNHILNSALSTFSYYFFGSSPFVLRIPNLLGFAFLVIGSFRIFNIIKSRILKYVLFSLLILSFNWISFFSTCRGYGLSMGLLLLSISYFFNFIQDISKVKFYVLYSIFIQLALSSNLTLIFLVISTLLYLVFVQIYNKTLWNKYNITLLILNLLIIVFWIKFIFFLKENNAFYLGKGDNYWKITFESLISIISGTKNYFINYSIAFLFVTVFILSIVKIKFYTFSDYYSKLKNPLFALLFCILSLIIGFWLLKLLFNVNYPEGRAALFFYILFVLLLTCYLDSIKNIYVRICNVLLIVISICHFTININFRKHSIEEYISIPEKFYDILLSEQQKNNYRITIGAHPYSELIYSFWNYRNNGVLNLPDPSIKMTMNFDYFIASMCDSNLYKAFYNELTREPDWGYALLKRKEKINREVTWQSDKPIEINGNNEFSNIFEFNDTLLTEAEPILVELDFDVITSPIPNLSWFVFEIVDSNSQFNTYKRIPINWLRSDWNKSKKNRYSFVSDKLPKNCKKIICYYWNFKKENNLLIINQVIISRLHGKGIGYPL